MHECPFVSAAYGTAQITMQASSRGRIAQTKCSNNEKCGASNARIPISAMNLLFEGNADVARGAGISIGRADRAALLPDC
jgi:hypothetical protein